jgi:hypothetical protein
MHHYCVSIMEDMDQNVHRIWEPLACQVATHISHEKKSAFISSVAEIRIGVLLHDVVGTWTHSQYLESSLAYFMTCDTYLTPWIAAGYKI